MARKRNTLRRIIVVGSIVTGSLLAAVPAMAVTTVSQQGSVGTFEGMGSAAVCTGVGLAGLHQVMFPSYIAVGEATRYGSYGQDVYMQQVMQRWNGSSWVNYVVKPWERDFVPATEGIALLTGGGEYNVQAGHYRVRMDFRWYVNGTLVGTVRDYLSVGDFWTYAASVGGGTIGWCSV